MGDDVTLSVAVAGPHDAEAVRRLLAGAYHLPGHAIRVQALANLPRLESGKVDYAAVTARLLPATSTTPATDLRRIFAEVLERTDVTDDSTFVGLGGDSLSYVEMTIRLEQALGTIPPNWHTTPIRDLRRRPSPPVAKRLRRMEAGVALRAVAIVLIAGTHMRLFQVPGSAHALLAAVGFNFARFTLSAADRTARVRRLGATIGRIAAISLPYIAVVVALLPKYEYKYFFTSRYLWWAQDKHYEWHYWFIFALLYLLLGVLVVLALPPFDRLERRYPFGLPVALAVLGLVARYQLIPGYTFPVPAEIFWLFAIGWAAARATRSWERVLLSALTIVTVIGFYPTDPMRNVVITLGILFLIWVSWVPSTRAINWIAGTLASSTLAIYVTHWQVFLPFQKYHLPLILALLACLVYGVLYYQLSHKALGLVEARWRDRPLWKRGRHRAAPPRWGAGRRTGA